MRPLILEVAPVLRLARVSTAFGAVAGLWLATLWSRTMPLERTTPQLEQSPLWLLLAGGALAGAGLYGFGAGLNDLLGICVRDAGQNRPSDQIVVPRQKSVQDGRATSPLIMFTLHQRKGI